MGAASLEVRITEAALALGFELCRFTPAHLSDQNETNLKAYTDKNYHGSMDWMLDTQLRRSHPKNLWPQAKSVIVLAMNYGPQSQHQVLHNNDQAAQISIYARHRDYHDIVKGKLKTLASKLVSWRACDVKVFVDTAPVMEKPLAANAGIGWQGKHTNLVSREFGSWLFLGSIFTDIELEADTQETDHCGNCRACLDCCPTKAFPAPYQIDARRCISYLTIEHKGPIPVEFRKPMANKIYGCDDCLAICPWNKFARNAHEIKLHPREELEEPPLALLANLDDAAFRKMFSGSPIKRIGRDRFLRNVLVAIGNSGDLHFLPRIEQLLNEPNEIVRGAAIWALRNLASADKVDQLREQYFEDEMDADVRQEWNRDID